MSQAVKYSRYARRVPQISLYTRTSRNTRRNNGKSLLAKKIIIQAIICIIVVTLLIWFRNSAEELPKSIISEIRLRVVERNITPQEICQPIADTWAECVRYIREKD